MLEIDDQVKKIVLYVLTSTIASRVLQLSVQFCTFYLMDTKSKA